MKAVMISINPKWCEKIASGQKTIEVRKTRPKIDTPFKCYIYCTNSGGTLFMAYDGLHYGNNYVGRFDAACINGKVIGEFICNKIENFTKAFYDEQEPRDTDIITDYLYKFNMTYDELFSYAGFNNFYGWHISDLVIYEQPKELSEFIRPCDRFLDCITCKRLVRNDYLSCDNKITRPPQSWCYVEEKE